MVARLIFGLTALISAASVLVQLVLVVLAVDVLEATPGVAAVGLGERVVRFFSYFTIESNVLVIVGTTMLALDPHRDGRVFRWVRIAGLIGILATFLVYLVSLLPLVAGLSGISRVTDVGLHILTPLLAVGGWLVLGPRPRLSLRIVLAALLWPVVYVVWSVLHGALTGWYPYPFVNVNQLGYPVALRNTAVVLVLMLVLGLAYLGLERLLTRRRTTG